MSVSFFATKNGVPVRDAKGELAATCNFHNVGALRMLEILDVEHAPGTVSVSKLARAVMKARATRHFPPLAPIESHRLTSLAELVSVAIKNAATYVVWA